MKAMLLATDDTRTERVCRTLSLRGHQAVYASDKETFFREFGLCNVIVAMGPLEPIGIWMWGYCYAKRKPVRAIHGVIPCPVSRKIHLDTWLDQIPVQLSLFPGDSDAV